MFGSHEAGHAGSCQSYLPQHIRGAEFVHDQDQVEGHDVALVVKLLCCSTLWQPAMACDTVTHHDLMHTKQQPHEIENLCASASKIANTAQYRELLCCVINALAPIAPENHHVKTNRVRT